MLFYLKLLDFAYLLFSFFGAKLATLFSRQNVTIPKTKKNKFVRIISSTSRQKFGSIERILTKLQQPQRFSCLLCPASRWVRVCDISKLSSFDINVILNVVIIFMCPLLDCTRLKLTKLTSYFVLAVLWGTFGAINELNNGYIAKANESFASYPLLTNFENLEFTVRTKSAPNLIIQLKSSNSEFLSVETDSNGYLQLRDKNGDINSSIPRFKKINDGFSHYVNVTPGGIEVDNKYYNVKLTSLQISTVFVGGLPETGDDLTAHAQFRGCIRDVRVNGQQLLFFNQTAAGPNSTQVNVARNCSGENVCASITGKRN